MDGVETKSFLCVVHPINGGKVESECMMFQIDKHNGLAMVEQVYRANDSHRRDRSTLSSSGVFTPSRLSEGSSSDVKQDSEEDCKEVLSDNNSGCCLYVEKYKLYVWSFKLHSLRVPNVLYLLSYHPKYMATYLQFVECLQNLPFQSTLLAYLGIMVILASS